MKSTRTATPAAPMDGFAPLLALQNAFRFWWVLVALTALGAMVGWAAHFLRPALYESIARLPVGIDYVNTGPMSQYEEDSALEVVGGLLTSQDVIDSTAARASAAGLDATPITLRQMMLLERRLNVWELRVRSTDPQTAEQIVNIWIEEGYAVIADSYRHAILADSLMRYSRSLETCLGRTANSEPITGQCSSMTFVEIQAALVQAGAQLYQEQVASRGLFSGLMIGQPERAETAPQPVRYGRAGFVLSGALIGLVLAVVLLETDLVRRFVPRS